MLWCLLLNAVVIPLAYYLIAAQGEIFGGYILLMIGHGVIGLLVPLYLTEIFPSSVRLSGVAISYNLSITSFAGFAPIIISALIEHYNWVILAPAAYVSGFVILALVTWLILHAKLPIRG